MFENPWIQSALFFIFSNELPIENIGGFLGFPIVPEQGTISVLTNCPQKCVSDFQKNKMSKMRGGGMTMTKKMIGGRMMKAAKKKMMRGGMTMPKKKK